MTLKNPTLLAALALLVASPTVAQPVGLTPRDGPLYRLRQADLCQLRIGGFISLTKPENNPTQGDIDLMGQTYAVAAQIIHEGKVLAKQVGPEAEKRVLDDLLPGWYAALKHGDGQPDKAAILRADIAPGLRTCIAHAQTLPMPPHE